MRKWLYALYQDDAVRYIFFGALTTVLNVATFYLFQRYTPMPTDISNIISVVLSILFAFVTNSAFVFHSQAKGMGEHLIEFGKFIGARMLTMVIEVVSVHWLIVAGMKDMLAKIVVTVIVIALNYVFSKFLVFVKKA